MPKKTKAIPDDRAEWSFGDALYWHFFIHGTRPDGDPDDATGQTWDPKKAAGAIGISVRGFWNWIDDRNYPYDTKALEKALFGDSKAFANARKELRRLLQEGRERQREAAAANGSTNLPAVITGQVVKVYTTPFEASEVDGPVTERDFRGLAPWLAENFGKTGGNPHLGGALMREPPIQGRVAGGPQSAAQPLRGNRKVVTLALAGLLILIGGYGTKRYFDYSNAGTVVGGRVPDKPPEKDPPKRTENDPPKNEAKGPSPEEKRAADEKRKQEERLAALEKKENAEAAAVKAKKEADARAVNIKLKALAQSETDDLCKKQLEGINVPGFTLKCDILIPFGKLLAKVGVSQTASSLGDCANRCRRESDCVAFSFDAGAHTGAASCYLTGSIPAQNPGKNWISGIRK